MDFSAWLSQVYTQHDYDMTVVAHVEPWDLSQFANPNYYWQYNNPQFAELINKADAAATNTEQETTLKEAAKLLAPRPTGCSCFPIWWSQRPRSRG